MTEQPKTETTPLERLHALPKVKETAFLALFAGAHSRITIFTKADGRKGAPHWGKAECEWVEDWENFYFHELVDLGLMKPELIKEGVAKGGSPGETWQEWKMQITDEGFDAREAWWADWEKKVKERAEHDAA